VYELEGLVAQGQGFPIRHDDKPVFWNVQEVHEHGPGFGGGQDLGLGEAFKHLGYATRMVLLGVLRHDIVDAPDAIERRHERSLEFRVDGVQKHRPFGALNQVSVVCCSIRQRDKRIEQPSVPMHRTDPIH
jgi:hypothetical protein